MACIKSVVIYGAGAMGCAVIAFLKKKDIQIKCVVDKNKNLKGTLIEDIEISFIDDLDDVTKTKCDFIVSMSACPYTEIRKYLINLGVKNVYSAGEYVKNIFSDYDIVNIWSEEKKILKELSTDMFSDKESIGYYKAACRWFSENDDSIHIGMPFLLDRNKYFPDFITKFLNTGDVMAETSVMNGEFTEKFISLTNGKVYTFSLHPYISDISFIRKKFLDNDAVIVEDIEISYEDGYEKRMRLGLMKPFTDFYEMEYKTVTIDKYFENIPYNFLRVYSMSEAYPILKNSIMTISKYRPIIAVNIGHYKNDFINIPIYLAENTKDYYLFFRIHSYQGNDCILYAIPFERVKVDI